MSTITLKKIKALFMRGEPSKIEDLKKRNLKLFLGELEKVEYYLDGVRVGKIRKTVWQGRVEVYPVDLSQCKDVFAKELEAGLMFYAEDSSGLIKHISSRELKQAMLFSD